MKLKGKGILITGGSQGFGKAVASACVAEGADVFICARGKEDLERTRAELILNATPGQRVYAKAADVSRADEVHSLVGEAFFTLKRLDGLVNNAGVYGPKGLVEDVDWTEWTRALEINLYGPILMCRAVLPIFRKQRHGKIVNLSGGGATSPMPRLSAYAATKAAIVRFTDTLAEETKDSGIDVNAIAPGALNTRLLDEVIAAGPEKVGKSFYEKQLKQKEEGGAPLDKGAQLTIFLLAEESNGITGRLISAIWDPWASLPKRLIDLQRSDIYTLRRIVPKDRGLDWDEK